MLIEVVMLLVIAALAGLSVRLKDQRDEWTRAAVDDAKWLKLDLAISLADADFWLETYQAEQLKGFKLSRRLRILRAQRGHSSPVSISGLRGL